MPAAAVAQATGTPSFNAPYRAFSQSEVGGVVSFPNGGGTALEGMYRFAFQQFDVGIRGGAFFPGNGFSNVFLVGAEGRERVISHTEQFPLDGAVVAGIGGRFVSGASALIIPFGLSLGRRLDVEGSQVSIVPYVQPTGFLISGSGSTNVKFDLGLGGDFRLSKVFDARVSIGVGDAVVEGFSVAAVWVH
jgi:hypothetical protein